MTLTYQYLLWDPTSPIYEEQESVYTNYKGCIINRHPTAWEQYLVIKQVTTTMTQTVADLMSDDNFPTMLESNMCVKL